VELVGNQLNVSVPYYTTICPMGSYGQFQWTLPALPAGTYSLHLYGYLSGYPDEPLPLDDLGSTQLIVIPPPSASTPTAIPTTSIVVRSGLALLMAAIALVLLRRFR